MTPNQLKEIRDRAEKATAGPWCRYLTDEWPPGWIGVRQDVDSETLTETHIATFGRFDDPNSSNDVDFVVHARQDIPALLAHIDTLEARVKELEEDGKLLDWVEKHGSEASLSAPSGHSSEWWVFFNDSSMDASGETLRQAIGAAIKASEGDSK